MDSQFDTGRSHLHSLSQVWSHAEYRGLLMPLVLNMELTTCQPSQELTAALATLLAKRTSMPQILHTSKLDLLTLTQDLDPNPYPKA